MDIADMPPALRARLAPYRMMHDTRGRSSASVFMFLDDHRPVAFLKVDRAGAFAEVPPEAERLRWLAAHNVPCPVVLADITRAGKNWLLTSALAGADLATPAALTDTHRVDILATALRELHNIDPLTCPFDDGLDIRLELARARLEAGVVDLDDFDEERRGVDPGRLLTFLETQRPQTVDLVVAHGDASLGNLVAHDRVFSGFVDCGRVGVADRYQDLAIAIRTVSRLGAPLLDVFRERYGLAEIDPVKLHYYKVLDEFF